MAMAVVVPGEEHLAVGTGILEYIDDLEDYYLAEARARKNRKTIPLADVERCIGKFISLILQAPTPSLHPAK